MRWDSNLQYLDRQLTTGAIEVHMILRLYNA